MRTILSRLNQAQRRGSQGAGRLSANGGAQRAGLRAAPTDASEDDARRRATRNSNRPQKANLRAAAIHKPPKNPFVDGSVPASRPHLSLPFNRALLYYPSCVHRNEVSNS